MPPTANVRGPCAATCPARNAAGGTQSPSVNTSSGSPAERRTASLRMAARRKPSLRHQTWSTGNGAVRANASTNARVSGPEPSSATVSAKSVKVCRCPRGQREPQQVQPLVRRDDDPGAARHGRAAPQEAAEPREAC